MINEKEISLVIILVLLIGVVSLLIVKNVDKSVPGVYGDKLKKFNSEEEIKNFLEENVVRSYGFGLEQKSDMQVGFEDGARGVETPSAGKSGGADRYSKTNVQVEGVDEPDIVKNDGKYIYSLSYNKLVVIDAYPAEEMKIVSEINFKNETARNIFINGDKLIVFTEKSDYVGGGERCGGVLYEGEKAAFRCGGYYKSSAHILIYDMRDKENPKLGKDINADGYYVDARMIGDYVYLISNKYVDLDYFELPKYGVNDKTTRIAPAEIYYFDNSDSNYNFNIISAINVKTGEVNADVYMLGQSSTIYVSQDNIYITYQKTMKPEIFFEEAVEEVLKPSVPFDYGQRISEIMNSELSNYEKEQKVNDVIIKYTEKLDAKELEDFSQEVMERAKDFQLRISKEIQRTIIHKIAVDDKKIEYKTRGDVPGTVLNQFSMDENDGFFRIATTTGGAWTNSGTENNLYVLDKDLEIVGKIEGLAKDERIYSIRFIGKRAYMVTFRQVDPLFVIDLSMPEKPKVLGYLKVTGYSSYLHPYDENHIIGVGQEANEQGRVSGVKISLFDVSDVVSPVEIGKYEVKEGSWSQTDVQYDHKAFLFDKDKELLVIPVSYNKEISSSEGWPKYEYWQGAFVFRINLEEGIKLRGRIAHEKNESKEARWYGTGQDYVRRSLYMDDVLYTISNTKVKANELMNLKEIKEVAWKLDDYEIYGPGAHEQ